MHELTRQTKITQEVKDKVYERDKGKCVLCGKSGYPNAHFIRRSNMGLGIEENILTLCRVCHRNFDENDFDGERREYLRAYLKSKYPGWDEEKLRYDKYGWLK